MADERGPQRSDRPDGGVFCRKCCTGNLHNALQIDGYEKRGERRSLAIGRSKLECRGDASIACDVEIEKTTK